MTQNRTQTEPPVTDWDTHLAEIRKRMRHHLRGVEPADVEDCSQRAALGLLEFVRRVGSPRSAVGLIEVIVRCTARQFLRGQYRHRRVFAELDRPDESPDLAVVDLSALEEEVTWKAMQVIEYFRRVEARCLELAEARARGEDLKQLSSRLAQSHDMLRQRWSRCVRGLRDAISKGTLNWTSGGSRRGGNGFE